MTIPTTGAFTSKQVSSEWGLSTPWTSAQLASAAGLGAAFASDDLRGLSSFSIDFPDVARFSTVATNGSSSTPNWRNGGARTVSGSATLYISIEDGGTGVFQLDAFKNGVRQQIAIANLNGPLTYNSRTLTLANGDSVYFRVVVGGENATQFNQFTSHDRSGTVTFRLNNASGPVIDTFSFNGSYSDTYRTGGGGGPIVDV